MRIHSGCSRLRPIAGLSVHWEVGNIAASPSLLLFIPPDVLLAFRPWATLEVSRGAIIEDTPIGRPGKAPLQIGIVSSDARSCQILLRLWIYATVDPRATGCAAIILEHRKPRHVRSITQRVRTLLTHFP